MIPDLKSFTVRLHNPSEDVCGRIQVQATCPIHARQVAVDQTIEISYPESQAEQWVVDRVEAAS